MRVSKAIKIQILAQFLYDRQESYQRGYTKLFIFKEHCDVWYSYAAIDDKTGRKFQQCLHVRTKNLGWGKHRMRNLLVKELDSMIKQLEPDFDYRVWKLQQELSQ